MRVIIKPELISEKIDKEIEQAGGLKRIKEIELTDEEWEQLEEECHPYATFSIGKDGFKTFRRIPIKIVPYKVENYCLWLKTVYQEKIKWATECGTMFEDITPWDVKSCPRCKRMVKA